MLRIIKVTGNSLFPSFQEGDFVVIIKIPFLLLNIWNYLPGDTVVLEHPYYGTLIKKIEWLSPDKKQYFVIGNNPNSTDSRQFGLVEYQWLLGKVVWHIQYPRHKKQPN